MPNTSNFGITYPANTDYVTNGASAMGTISTQIDTLLAAGQFMGGFRNRLINGDMSVWQRGTSAFTNPNAYTADRWIAVNTGTNHSTTRQATTLGSVVPNSVRHHMQVAVTPGAGTGDYLFMAQRIENVGTFAGKTVTVSFYAWSASGTPKIGISLDQAYGTGGSPSATDFGTGQAVTISTTPTRYSRTFTVPSISGKTRGTNNDDYLQLTLWLDAGSTLNTRSGSIGHQTATFAITGVQIEAGSYATDFEFRPPQVELSLCQRYYYRWQTQSTDGFVAMGSVFTSADVRSGLQFPTTLRSNGPSVYFRGGNELELVISGTVVRSTTTTPTNVNSQTCELIIVPSASLTSGQACQIRSYDTACWWEVVAEL